MNRWRRGELWIDVAWVVVSGVYVLIASGYPPAGRLIPMVIGSIACITGAVQLAGNFVPGMRRFTHDREVADPVERPSVSATHGSMGNLPPEQLPSESPHAGGRADAATEARRQWIGIGWAAGLVAGLFVLGFVVTVPLFFLAYFLLQRSQRNWKVAVSSAVIMGGVTYGVFDQVLGLHLYNGIFLTPIFGS